MPRDALGACPVRYRHPPKRQTPLSMRFFQAKMAENARQY
jgi:hypothetical protein